MALIYDVAFNSQTRVLSLLDKAGNVISACEVPSKSKELKLTATVNNSSVTLTKVGTLSNKYEVNTGSGWEAYTFGTVIPLNRGDSVKWRCSNHPTTQSDVKYVKFVMTGSIEASGNVNSMLSSNFQNIASLSGYDYAFCQLFYGCTALTQAPDLPATTLADYCYYGMFSNCTSLTQAPALPATTLANFCYYSMFFNCTSLTQAPALPATTLTRSCYQSMFSNCTSLTKAPELPATTLSSRCYHNMFNKCTSLTKAPELPATTLSIYCYENMFYNCSSLAEVHVAATTTAGNALDAWLFGVSASGDFYCNPNATIFPTDSSSGIPVDWNRWVYGAEDTGTTTTMYHNGSAETVRVGTSSYGTCYSAQGWTGFKSLAEMHAIGYTLSPQTSVTVYYYEDAVLTYYVSANVEDNFTETMYDVGNGMGYLTIAQLNNLGYYLVSTTFTGLTLTATADNSSVQLNKVGTGVLDRSFRVNTGNGWSDYTFGTVINLNSGQFCQWVRSDNSTTTQNTSNFVKFTMTGTIEASGNCNSMLSEGFANITSLDGHYSAFTDLFSNCTSLTQAPQLPATTLTRSCYQSMFSNCTSLTKAPELPATTVAGGSYSGMFSGCTNLAQAPALPATTIASSCYTEMFSGCTNLAQVPDLPATNLYQKDYCYQGMFKNCTTITHTPPLRAVSLTRACYQDMFSGCSNLVEVGCSAKSYDQYVYPLSNWLANVSASGYFYCDPTAGVFPKSSTSGIPANWKRLTFVDDSIDTGTTTSMYHNGVSETVRVGTSVKYGNCYAIQGKYYFNTLSDMHSLGYTFGAQTPMTLYRFEEAITVSYVAANVDDGSEALYDIGDGNGFVTASKLSERGVFTVAKQFTGLTFTATANDSSVKLSSKGVANITNQFMYNTGTGWQSYTLGTSIPLNNGQSCEIYCNAHPDTQTSSKRVGFDMTGTIEASGNCNSMLGGNFEGIRVVPQYAFYCLFLNCASLTRAPEIPSTAVETSGYDSMFQGCTALAQAPQLPATTLVYNCYQYMFFGCTSLTKTPELPATTLSSSCYKAMFSGCQSLAEVRIAATTMASNALQNWLTNVSATGDFYCNPNATIFPTGTSGIPSGWTRHALADYPVTP